MTDSRRVGVAAAEVEVEEESTRGTSVDGGAGSSVGADGAAGSTSGSRGGGPNISSALDTTVIGILLVRMPVGLAFVAYVMYAIAEL
ncbi:hypothetical protein [Mycobacteroides franklinii]|uniref:hypothetical protein n=1 Tax=Mycobacteroides franklinii TaxID=948102 RepID=UPI0012FF6171|nr:hypothetical protein [Mycobacteroides franklinii]